MFQSLKCRFDFHRKPHPYARWFRGHQEIGECLECFRYVSRHPGQKRWRVCEEWEREEEGTAPRTRRVFVRVDGLPKTICQIDEDRQGNAFLKVKPGKQAGVPSNQRTIEQCKYSLHVSERSLRHNMIERRLETNGFPPQISRSLTDAVASKRGFAPIFMMRIPDLSDDAYDFSIDSSEELIELSPFQSRKNTLMVGVFVGHKDTSFTLASKVDTVEEFSTKLYNLIVVYRFNSLPTIASGHIMDKVKYSPKVFETQEGRAMMRAHMESMSAEDCITLFDSFCDRTIRNQAGTIMNTTDDQDVQSYLAKMLDSLPSAAHSA